MKHIEKGFIERNKKLLVIVAFVFIVFALAGAIMSYVASGDNYGMISKSFANVSSLKESVQITSPEDTIPIFLHNLTADSIMVLGGFLFSIISLFALCFNAASIGFPFGSDLLFASAGILPHGIIEYSATIVSVVAALKITKLEIEMIKTRSFRSVLTEHKVENSGKTS